MGYDESAGAGCRTHCAVLGEAYAYAAEWHYRVDVEYFALVGQRGIAHGGAYAFIILSKQMARIFHLCYVVGVAPIGVAYA